MTANLPAGTQILQFKGATHPVLFENADPVAAQMRKILTLWPQTEPASSSLTTTVIGEDDGYTVNSLWLDDPIEGLEDVAAACGAIVDSAQSVIDANRDWLCLHCATYEIGGKLVVLTGSARAGKSTLAARMAAEDVLVYCDDMLPLTAPDNNGFALGIPPRPRLPLPEGAGSVLENHVANHAAARDSRYCYLDSTHLAPHGRTAPIGVVILLDRRADGPAGFTPANRAEALKHLFLRNMVRVAPTPDIADRLEAVLESVPCVKLHYSRLDDAAELLMTSFGTWPMDERGLLADPKPAGTPLPEARQEQAGQDNFGVEHDTLYLRAPGVTLRTHDGEGFLFDPHGTEALHLNPLAHSVWMLLDTPISARTIADMLAVAFPEIDATTVLDDVAALIARMETHDVVTRAEA